MRFDERHPGLLQIEGGIAIAARPRRALQEIEVWQKLSSVKGGGGGNPIRRRGIIAGALPWSRATGARVCHLALARLALTPETSLEDCLVARQS